MISISFKTAVNPPLLLLDSQPSPAFFFLSFFFPAGSCGCKPPASAPGTLTHQASPHLLAKTLLWLKNLVPGSPVSIAIQWVENTSSSSLSRLSPSVPFCPRLSRDGLKNRLNGASPYFAGLHQLTGLHASERGKFPGCRIPCTWPVGLALTQLLAMMTNGPQSWGPSHVAPEGPASCCGGGGPGMGKQVHFCFLCIPQNALG